MSQRRVIRVSTLTFVMALKRLMGGPATAADIEEVTGLHRNTVYRLLGSMVHHDTAHISGSAPDKLGRLSVRVYSIGPDPKKV